MVSLRPLGEDEADAVAALATELGYGATAAEMLPRLRAVAGDPRQLALGAEDAGGRLVGWVHAHRSGSLQSPPAVEITGLVVTAALRGRGVGAELLAAVADWARALGVFRIRVRSNVARDATQAFYLGRGYREVKRQVVFERGLDG